MGVARPLESPPVSTAAGPSSGHAWSLKGASVPLCRASLAVPRAVELGGVQLYGPELLGRLDRNGLGSELAEFTVGK